MLEKAHEAYLKFSFKYMQFLNQLAKNNYFESALDGNESLEFILGALVRMTYLWFHISGNTFRLPKSFLRSHCHNGGVEFTVLCTQHINTN